MLPAPFTVTEPEGLELPVVVEVPHAGLAIPPEFMTPIVAPLRSIGRDADLFVDTLYEDAPAAGASLLVANLSRYVVDLNRAETDVDADVAVGAPLGPRLAHGLVWRLTTDGERALSRPVSREELALRLDAVHRPYHAALRALIERKRARFGTVIVLAAHSMPSVARAGHVDAGERADVVPGSRGRTSAHPAIIDAVEAHAREAGLSVRHDEPYRGGYTTMHYGRPDLGIHVIQVELARRLYMDEHRLVKDAPRFARTQDFCLGLVRRLGELGASLTRRAAE